MSLESSAIVKGDFTKESLSARDSRREELQMWLKVAF